MIKMGAILKTYENNKNLIWQLFPTKNVNLPINFADVFIEIRTLTSKITDVIFKITLIFAVYKFEYINRNSDGQWCIALVR